jgi:hypothetical protein
MSTVFAVPRRFMSNFSKLKPDIEGWLRDTKCEYYFGTDEKYGPCLLIEDDDVALMFKLVFADFQDEVIE